MTHSPTILLVDDEMAVGWMLSTLFADYGVRTLCAYTSAEALAALDLVAIDGVICDVMLPGQSGLEVVARIRAARPDTPIPAVILSALPAAALPPLPGVTVRTKPTAPHALVRLMLALLAGEPAPLADEAA